MYCSDSHTGSLAASVFEVQCSLVHPKNIVDDEPDWPLRRRGIIIYRRAVVPRTRRSDMRCPDIFHFVESSSTRTRILFAVKNGQTSSI
jgi:hypothetical protein